MKKLKQSGVILFSGFLLAACGDTTADIADNWTEYIEEGNENLENYSSDTQLNLVIEMGRKR